MGLLDGLIGQVAGSLLGGGAGNAQQGQLTGTLLSQLDDPAIGGLGGLLGKLQAGGLGDAVAAWVSTGPNPPVGADQLQSALGPQIMTMLAQKVGLPANVVGPILAQLLPVIVDKLTPDGKVPEPEQLRQNIAALQTEAAAQP